MPLTSTHIAYLHTCHRKLWLFANGIQMEHTSELVSEGKLIAESSYLDRARKYTELEVENVKIDFYDPRKKIVHEVKKTDKMENAHIAQVKYYLYVLAKNGVEEPSGVIEYPKLRQRVFIEWDEGILTEVIEWEEEVGQIMHLPSCPPLIEKPICKKCSYFELCYIAEEE